MPFNDKNKKLKGQIGLLAYFLLFYFILYCVNKKIVSSFLADMCVDVVIQPV